MKKKFISELKNKYTGRVFRNDIVNSLLCGRIWKEEFVPEMKPFSVYYLGNKKWFKDQLFYTNLEDGFINSWFKNKVDYWLNRQYSVDQIKWRRGKNRDRLEYYENYQINTYTTMQDLYSLQDRIETYRRRVAADNRRREENRVLGNFIIFIHKVEIPYIIERYDGGINNFISKNNAVIMNDEEVYLNLSEEDVEVIKARWLKDIKMEKSIFAKAVNDRLKVDAIDLMLMLLKCKGNLSECARKLKISRHNIKLLIEDNATLYKIYLEIEEMFLDYVEYKLTELVDAGDRNAIQYFLNAKGGQRGYGSYESRRRVNKTVRGEELRSNDFEIA